MTPNSRKLVGVIVGLVVLLLAGTVLAYIFGRRAYFHAQSARASVSLAEAAIIAQQDFSKAVHELKAGSEQFKLARKNLQRILYLRLVPWVSRQHKTGAAILYAASLATDALATAVETADKIYTPFKSSPEREIGAFSVTQRQELLSAIENNLPALKGAANDLVLARERLEAIHEAGFFTPFKDEIDRFKDRATFSGQILEDSIPLLEVVPELLGYPEKKSYLFILQNSDELRPTGGFIGTYGVLTFEAGHITNFFTDDVYNLDRFSPLNTRPSTPLKLRQYLAQPKWFLRDANFSPDFSEAAQRVLQFYREEVRFIPAARPEHQALQVDGLLAVMPEAIAPILKLVGPITVSGQTFNADNLTDALEFEVEIGFESKGIPRPQRKDIIAALGHELIAKVMGLPVSKWPEVLHLVRQALDERQILLYSEDFALQEKIVERDWGGVIKETDGDYLAVFDANMFALKTDPYVSRAIFYKVMEQGAAVVGEVEIVYTYPKAGPFWKTKGYRTYSRVYVPAGSILQTAQGAMQEEELNAPGEVEIGQEFGKTFFGAFVALQVGEEKHLRFTYRLPENIAKTLADGNYELTVQKQAGTLGPPLTVVADFGKLPAVWSPRGLKVKRENTTLTWQTSLRIDQAFKIEF